MNVLYNTKILQADEAGIAEAAELIKDGEIVGMPTETVYGLAADATNESAVRKIFEAKGRPQDNPLIVHIADINMLEKYVHDVPEAAYRLAEKFCPGPLTMVLPKRDIIPYVTSAGLDTVGIRIPLHKTARELISVSGRPIAAPSANTSGMPSPTTAMHVYHDMNGKIPAIIDGGASAVGVESTVVSFENGGIRLLRPGLISVEKLQSVGLPVFCDKGITQKIDDGEKVLSPGMKYKHYSPKANVTIIKGNIDEFVKYVSEHNGSGVYAVVFDRDKTKCPFECLTYGDTSEEQAAEIFGILRHADDINAKQLYFRCPSQDGVGLAVYNRLLRAAGFEVIDV